MIKAASVGLGWWSDELAKSIQGKSKKIKIVSCYSRNKRKRVVFSTYLIQSYFFLPPICLFFNQTLKLIF